MIVSIYQEALAKHCTPLAEVTTNGAYRTLPDVVDQATGSLSVGCAMTTLGLSVTRSTEDFKGSLAVRRSNGRTRKPSIAVFHTNSTLFPSISGIG